MRDFGIVDYPFCIRNKGISQHMKQLDGMRIWLWRANSLLYVKIVIAMKTIRVIEVI
jgi:hypothetical protein